MPRLWLLVVASVVVLVVLVGGTGWAQTIDGSGDSSVGTETAAAGPRRAIGIASSFEEAVGGAVRRSLSAPNANSSFRVSQQPHPQKGNWIRRHPALFGALLGFGVGFLIGYSGDDAVFDDFTAGFNGLVLGGVGAVAGSVVGEVATR
jgi:hypothetical protein